MSRRDMDMRAEEELSAFLDTYFYANLLDEGKFESIERVHDNAMQKRGVDVVAKTDCKTYHIDEKAQLYYLNKALPTFAFELDYLSRGQRRIGWLLNDELLTDYYFLIWPFAQEVDLRLITKDDFTALDCLMLNKKKLLSFLEQCGLNKRYLQEQVKTLRKNECEGKQPTGIKGVYFYVSSSSKYSEAPINLVIAKNILIELSDAHYEITKEQGLQRK